MACDSLPDLIAEVRAELNPGILLLEIFSGHSEMSDGLWGLFNSALARQLHANALLDQVLETHGRERERRPLVH
jgi:hypothetical protein